MCHVLFMRIHELQSVLNGYGRETDGAHASTDDGRAEGLTIVGIHSLCARSPAEVAHHGKRKGQHPEGAGGNKLHVWSG
jgi:hypothetical protein